MVKEESVERGDMTPEEVRAHLKKRNYKSPLPGWVPNYHSILGQIFSKGNRRGLLSKGTKDSIKQVMGEMAIDDMFKRKATNGRTGEDITYDMLNKFANQVRFFHDVYKPDYIFLNETGATPLGYALKEAWRTAYPGEKPPVFLRIIPGRGSKEFFEKRIKDKNSKIFVYDECVEQGSSLIRVGESLSEAGYRNIMLGISGRDGGIRDDRHYKVGDKPKFSTPDYFSTEIFNPETEEEWNRAYQITQGAGFGNIGKLKDSFGGVTYKGWEITDSHDRGFRKAKGDVGEIAGSTAVVHTYKAMGKYVGEYIASEAQKKENSPLGGLEKTVATVSIIALVGSIFFIGSSVTGNAIGNIGRSSGSWIGIGLLLVGIAGALVYFRSKK
jgi:hypothetical protein